MSFYTSYNKNALLLTPAELLESAGTVVDCGTITRFTQTFTVKGSEVVIYTSCRIKIRVSNVDKRLLPSKDSRLLLLTKDRDTQSDLYFIDNSVRTSISKALKDQQRYQNLVLMNDNGVMILSQNLDLGGNALHATAWNAQHHNGYELLVAPALYQANHRPGNPILVDSSFEYQYEFSELVVGKQPRDTEVYP